MTHQCLPINQGTDIQMQNQLNQRKKKINSMREEGFHRNVSLALLISPVYPALCGGLFLTMKLWVSLSDTEEDYLRRHAL